MKKLSILLFLAVFYAQTSMINAITTLTYTDMNDIMPNGVLDTSKYPALYNEQVETYKSMDSSSDSAQKFAQLWNWMVEDYQDQMSGGDGVDTPSEFSATKEGNISSDKSTQASKAATKLLGGVAKGATTVATKIGTTALKNAVTKDSKIDDEATKKFNSLIDDIGTNVTKTASAVTDHAVTLGSHSIDFDAGLISADELAVYAADAKGDLIKDTGAIAGNIIENAGSHAGEIAQYYLEKAGDTPDPKKVEAAELILEEAKENLETAKKLGSKDYIELAEKQVEEAEKALEEAKTPNKYLKTLADSAGELAKELGKAAGEVGNAAVTITSEAKSDEIFEEADLQWNKITGVTPPPTEAPSSSNAGGLSMDFGF